MANQTLFKSLFAKGRPKPDTVNHEQAPAYRFSPQHTLAQYAATGCLHNTFYAHAEDQLQTVLGLARQVDPTFVAQTAIYSRKRGHMKDMPALLTASLSSHGMERLPQVFDRVIDNGRMVRNYVQIMRSGATGRRSLGTRPKRLVQNWLNSASAMQLIRASVGQNPSLKDVIRMVHPKPVTAEREALFAYFLGRAHDPELLPEVLQAFERFKKDRSAPVPDVPFQMLTALDLDAAQWAAIARQAGWHMVRMNLNTFARHGVFALDGMTETIAYRLADAEEIARARVFPYQIMAAWASIGGEVPGLVKDALEDAMESAIDNVPEIPGRVVVCPDVSGSMCWPVTGYQGGGGASSKVTCNDVAALIASAVLRKNPGATVMPFEHRVVNVTLNAKAGVLRNARALARIGGGGTDCSAPLAQLNRSHYSVDMVIMISDNESWFDAKRGHDTGTMRQWQTLKRRNPDARLVCIDLTPYGTTQAPERSDILNIGGFSDAVFETLAAFATGTLNPEHWVGRIKEIAIEP
ncbi:MAG: TROVE domain-containing protein [Magnetococcales bacterium]|nr:TROVE domain-containing protein [Magnetococcales bacterium]